MEEKSRPKKTALFLCILFIVCVAAFFLYYVITGKQNPLFKFINNGDETENKILDNYNGFYSNYESLNGSKFIFSGCSISKIANYILVIEDNYYLFRSTCMGTYEKEKGKVEDLDIKVDEEKKTYYIYHNDVTYEKDDFVNSIRVNNDIEKKMTEIDLSTYQLFMRETEFEGNYYDLEQLSIKNTSAQILMDILRYEDDKSFIIRLRSSSSTDRVLYSKAIKDFDFLPDIYTYGSSIVVVEKNKSEDNKKYSYKFFVIKEDGIVYNVDEKFPIIVDGKSLNKENSVYIKFDPAKRYFRMLIGNDDKMCVDNYEDSEKDDITYYEFSLEYNYLINNFNEPKFQKIGRKSEGCRYVNELIEG